MTALPEKIHDLLDAPEVATLATIEPDGQPQMSVIWVKREGDEVLFSTVRGRRKALNMERDPRATIVVVAAKNPFRYVEIRGAVRFEDDPEGRLIDELSRVYKGEPWTADRVGTERVIVRLAARKVVCH
jgi:PPOX class probable F420-dependent enzyme